MLPFPHVMCHVTLMIHVTKFGAPQLETQYLLGNKQHVNNTVFNPLKQKSTFIPPYPQIRHTMRALITSRMQGKDGNCHHLVGIPTVASINPPYLCPNSSPNLANFLIYKVFPGLFSVLSEE